MSKLQLILVDPKPVQCDAWEAAFHELPRVQIVRGYFEELAIFDCIVSPANSFGLMDGGIDLAIVQFFGRQLEKRVQNHILEKYLGEQPVGTSFIVETGHEKHPYLAHTPTMRTPMTIEHTDYPYLAMWALLLAVREHNQRSTKKITTIGCPGLGTGTGQVFHHEAARQMAAAYRNFLFPPDQLTWRFADDRQSQIKRGGDLGYMLSAMQKRSK